MKEKIYTIPVNEAFEQDCECPVCYLKNKLEKESVEYALGAAMMEPDYRLISNEKGYCNHHYALLFEKTNKLSLALVLDTHLAEVKKKIDELSANVNSFEKVKTGLFSKKSDTCLKDFGAKISEITDSCIICEKLSSTMKRYTSVVFYLWEKEPDFQKKLLNSRGFCIPHFNTLIEASFEFMNRKKASEFSKLLYEKEKKELERIQADIHNFTLKFDYRNKDSKWGTEIDAPIRTLEKLAGYIHQRK